VKNKKIVAVVGLGHLDGMEEFWTTHKERAKKLGLYEEDFNKQ
jgi:pheromone shutdown protein TraB